MSTIVATTTTVTGSFQLAETALTASDILTYTANKGQQLNIRNPNITALSSPIISLQSTSATGGTLPANTYYYEVSALNTNGETYGSNEVVLTTAPSLATPVQTAASTSTTGGTGLAASTAYFYVVSALNARGETLKSNEISITTGAGATNSNTVNWGLVSGATNYKIYRGTSAGTEGVYYTVGSVATFLDTGAASTVGTPSVTNTTSVTNSNTLTWSSIPGATGYKVYRGTSANGENVYYTLGNVLTYTDTGSAGTTGSLPNSNTTAGATITITVKGTAPVSPVIPGAGQVFNTSGGYSISVAPQTTQCINLDRISNYIAGTANAVAVTGGTGCFASILQP